MNESYNVSIFRVKYKNSKFKLNEHDHLEIRNENTVLNETLIIENLEDVIKETRLKFKEKKGFNLREGVSAVREVVVDINSSTSLLELKEFASLCSNEMGIKAFQYYIHKDQGYTRNGITIFKEHAHILFDVSMQNGSFFQFSKSSMEKIRELLAISLGVNLEDSNQISQKMSDQPSEINSTKKDVEYTTVISLLNNIYQKIESQQSGPEILAETIKENTESKYEIQTLKDQNSHLQFLNEMQQGELGEKERIQQELIDLKWELEEIKGTEKEQALVLEERNKRISELETEILKYKLKYLPQNVEKKVRRRWVSFIFCSLIVIQCSFLYSIDYFKTPRHGTVNTNNIQKEQPTLQDSIIIDSVNYSTDVNDNSDL